MIHEYMKIQDNKCVINYCTYLNGGLLGAPREYVLHGLVPGLNWAPLWPHPMSMHLVTTPSSVSCFLLHRFKFHTLRLLLFGWLLTNVQVNITTTPHDTWHTCIYITLVLLFISSFLHLPFSWAGLLPLTRTVCYSTYMYIYEGTGFTQTLS